MCKSHNIMSLLRDMKLVSRDKSVDLTGVLLCRATMFECLRHDPDLLLFRSIAWPGDLLSKHAPGILKSVW